MKLELLTLVAVCALPLAASAQTSSLVRINTDNAQTVAAELEAAGFDVLRGTITAESLELIVLPAELSTLKADGYDLTMLAQGRPFREIQLERQAQAGPDPVPPGYLDLAEVIDEMNAAAASFPAICKMVDLTATLGTPTTYEGRHMYAVKISDNVNQDEDEPAFLMVSNHHAREIVTPVIALHTIEQFTTKYGVDPQVTALVDEYEIWIAPVWNPDGYVYVFDVNNMWRKNRTPYPGGVGVDQNRNYPFGWSSACSGSSRASSSTYKGPGAASEAETQTMIKLTEAERFAKVIDFHSSGRETLYGYRCHTHPFKNWLQSEAQAVSTASGYQGDVRPPSAEGEHYEWQLSIGAYANLTETASSFQPPYASAQAEARLVWPGTLWILERPISLSGHVTDFVTGKPVEAAIKLQGVNFPNGETNGSGGPFGRYHQFLPPGIYTVRFSATGYLTQSFQVTATLNSAEILDVVLIPDNCPGDINGDKTVGPQDLTLLLAAWQSKPGDPNWNPKADINGDGIVSSQDLTILLAFWMTNCP